MGPSTPVKGRWGQGTSQGCVFFPQVGTCRTVLRDTSLPVSCTCAKVTLFHSHCTFNILVPCLHLFSLQSPTSLVSHNSGHWDTGHTFLSSIVLFSPATLFPTGRTQMLSPCAGLKWERISIAAKWAMVPPPPACRSAPGALAQRYYTHDEWACYILRCIRCWWLENRDWKRWRPSGRCTWGRVKWKSASNPNQLY